MKKITDERLKMKNLKSIRILYGVLFTGIILILIYEGITNGMSTVTQSPLWFLFLLNGILVGFFSMPISVEINDEKPLKYRTIILISLGIGIVSGGLVYWPSREIGPAINTFILSTGIFFFILIIYRIITRKVQQD